MRLSGEFPQAAPMQFYRIRLHRRSALNPSFTRRHLGCMKKLDAFKLSLLTASVVGLGVGCASSGSARTDNGHVTAVGTSASADVGTGHYTTTEYDHCCDQNEGAARVTVSALSFVPETRANWVNRFPFYDQQYRLVNMETYTFAVPDPNLHASANNGFPEFSVNLPPGSVFVESAGGAGAVRTGRIIQHSPMTSH
jgi:hypothetical protein